MEEVDTRVERGSAKGMGVEYFFDSYAAIEIIRKNPSYERFLDARIRITWLNLLEIAYIVRIQLGLESAREAFQHFREFVVEVPDGVVLEAIDFRARMRNKSFSYADCLGYVLAMKRKLTFLTGDDAFKTLPGVIFVK